MLTEKLPHDFVSPPREFSQAPFWFWNDDLSEPGLVRQMEDFQDHGIHAFVIHPRAGLPRNIGWLSDRMLHFMRFTVEEAARRKMWVILYDEGMYPSGSSSGQVVGENPAFATRGLVCIDLDTAEPDSTVEKCRIDREGRLRLGEAQKLVAEVRRRTDNHRLAVVDLPTGSHIRGLHFLEADAKRRPDHMEVPEDSPAAADLLNPEAVQCFIRLVYERLYRALGEHFGKTIRAIFTDEPNPLSKGSGGRAFHPVAGTTGILNFVSERLGYDFTRFLPALWYDDEPEAAKHRADYHRAIENRLAETYYRPVSRWCHEHDIALTGHPGSPEDIGQLRYFQWPGQDIVLRYIEPGKPSALEGAQSTQAKCASSVMLHGGRRRNANEYCGAYGHEFLFEEMRWLAAWLLVRGCNLLMPHAFYYSVRGPRIDERPRDVGPNSPWWDRFRTFTEACSRLCWLNTDSRHVCRVAILCTDHSLPWQSARRLFENQRDFNYLEVRRLREDAAVDDEGIHLADITYDVLIHEIDTPGVLKTTGKAAALLQAIERSGRLVRWHSEMEDSAFMEKLDERLDRDIRISPPAPSLRYRHIIKKGEDYYILFNEGGKKVAGTLELEINGDVLMIDPEILDCHNLPGGQKTHRISLEPHQLTILRGDN